MSKGHDVFRQMNHIMQSLSQNKKPIGFFLSAGCPLSIRVIDGQGSNAPLIQDIAGLTRNIAEQLTADTGKDKTSWDKLVSICKEDGLSDANIEQILTQVRALRNVAGASTVRGLSEKELGNLDADICKIISVEVDKNLPDTSSPYHNLAMWARAIKRDKPVHIFTTNYDLLAEQALEESYAPYFDGFIGARKAFFDLAAVEDESILPPSWTRLWKIHGSINWRLEDKGRVSRTDSAVEKANYLIYPSHLKYDQNRKMPYLAMMDRLKDYLLKPSAIIFFSGYSFGDEHINDVICRSLQSNPTAMAFGLLHGKLSEEVDGGKYTKAIECAKSTSNLSLFALDRAIIGRTEMEWMRSGESDANFPSDLIDCDDKNETCKCNIGDFKIFSEVMKIVEGRDDAED